MLLLKETVFCVIDVREEIFLHKDCFNINKASSHHRQNKLRTNLFDEWPCFLWRNYCHCAELLKYCIHHELCMSHTHGGGALAQKVCHCMYVGCLKHMLQILKFVLCYKI